MDHIHQSKTGEGHRHQADHHHEHDSHHYDHAHSDADYYLEQLLTISVAGGFGIVSVLMERFGMLNELLAPEFHRWVALGGVALIAVSMIRVISLWSEVSAYRQARHHHEHLDDEHHAHVHEHGADCQHDHHHHEHHHEHIHHHHGDHGHEHGNIFWRIVVLSFPLLLFFFGLPNEHFMKSYKLRKLGTDAELGTILAVQSTGNRVPIDFDQLAYASMDPAKRAALQGNVTSIIGQYKPISDREFTLFKLKMNCCAADMVPLKARIITNSVPYVKPFDWIQVTGVIQFIESPGRNEFIPILHVNDDDGIQPAKPVN
jgi:hypothetical protein